MSVLNNKKQIRLIAFDLDGTIAEPGQGILPENLELIRQFEDSGIRIAIVSGKPTYYLCGLFRQAGLKDPVFAGENGAVIHMGVDLPPKYFYVQKFSDESVRSIAFLKQALADLIPDLWYQPNLVGIAAFPHKEEEFELIQQMIDENRDKIVDVDIYRHFDCFDFAPKGLSKFTSLQIIGEKLGISPEETVCFGDGVNDGPMFKYAGTSVGVHYTGEAEVDVNFATIHEGLIWLKEQIL